MGYESNKGDASQHYLGSQSLTSFASQFTLSRLFLKGKRMDFPIAMCDFTGGQSLNSAAFSQRFMTVHD